MKNQPVLYILMRTDMASMNPGKAMAQANHAYGALKKALRTYPARSPVDLYMEWQKQTDQDFGTTITLGGTESDIENAVTFSQNFLSPNVAAGWVHDPTYPLIDGDTLHLIPVRTCAFIFGKKEDCSGVLAHLTLHP